MTYVAVSTGEAAGELAEQTGNVEAMLERHEELAETTRAIFTVLTLVFAGALVVPALLKRKLEGCALPRGVRPLPRRLSRRSRRAGEHRPSGRDARAPGGRSGERRSRRRSPAGAADRRPASARGRVRRRLARLCKSLTKLEAGVDPEVIVHRSHTRRKACRGEDCSLLAPRVTLPLRMIRSPSAATVIRTASHSVRQLHSVRGARVEHRYSWRGPP